MQAAASIAGTSYRFGAPLTRLVDLIVVHCSATPSGARIGTGLPTPAGMIDLWHRQRGFMRLGEARSAFNWRFVAIGYHFVIDVDGSVQSGRHLNEKGAHVAGQNARSIGICLVGGAEREARYTAPQWGSLAALVTRLRTEGVAVRGHRDLSPDLNGDGKAQPNEWLKTCPGFEVSDWLARGMAPLPNQLCAVPA